MNGVTAMDENGDQEIKSPMKRMGSTRKLVIFNSKLFFFIPRDIFIIFFLMKIIFSCKFWECKNLQKNNVTFIKFFFMFLFCIQII